MVYQVSLPGGLLNCRTAATTRYSSNKPINLHLPVSHSIALPWNPDAIQREEPEEQVLEDAVK
jgi:hypothetical protein